MLDPSRSYSPVCSTRSSLACPASDRVPISSRNSVPPLRRLEAADAASLGAREGAGFGAEQLGLEQRVGQRPDVDGDERAAGTRASWPG